MHCTQVPGFRTAVASVQDRSKPFVGAMVLEQLYGKFKDKWIVELLFDVSTIRASNPSDRALSLSCAVCLSLCQQAHETGECIPRSTAPLRVYCAGSVHGTAV